MTIQGASESNSILPSGLTSLHSGGPPSLGPINEQQMHGLRKASVNLNSGRQAMVLYNAPVVQDKFKRVTYHFKKSKNSFNGQRLEPIASTKRSEEEAGFEIQHLAVSQEQKSEMRSPLKLLSDTEGVSVMSGTPMDVKIFGHSSLKSSPKADRIKEYFDNKRKNGTSVQRVAPVEKPVNV